MSRHKILARRCKIFAVLCVFTAAAVMIAADFGILPKDVVEQCALTLVVPILAIEGYLLAWGKARGDAMRRCERCGRHCKGQRHSRKLRGPWWWGQFVICEGCAKREDFLLSLPNREYAYDNKPRAARWGNITALVLLLFVGAFTGLFVCDHRMAHAAAVLTFWCCFVAHGVVSARSSYYWKSFCARCARDFEKYEARWCSSEEFGRIICEHCADKQHIEAGDDDDDDGEPSYG